MAKFELKLPKMGESVAEATITAWLKEVGDTIELDEAIVEIATDKVDSEVPSEVAGTLIEKKYNVDDVVAVGETIAIIETDADAVGEITETAATGAPKEVAKIEKQVASVAESIQQPIAKNGQSGRFYSPLVRNIAKTEGISMEELEAIPGSGKEGRVTKKDILAYLENGRQQQQTTQQTEKAVISAPKPEKPKAPLKVNQGDEIIEMSRMGKMIAKHMIDSVQTSAHVQSFVEVDVTNIVKWRNKVKDAFFKREGEKLTFTPIFMEAVAKALKDYPMMNISVDGDKIIKRKNINLGMAAAL
ncbi:MAG TPA: 2-oxo acid dehydrogenase subunit E2, partial [Flavobacteriia bacterium]|nr:2-oxo acid dehydrogenase subunit E2 [Flavobacteriia bacterium]